MLATDYKKTSNPDALNMDAWMKLRRQNAYDLRALQPAATKQAAAPPSISSYFPGAEALEDQDLSGLRAEQAKQHAGEEDVDRQNRWMLAPVFGPEALLGAAEMGGLLGLRFLTNRAPAAVDSVKPYAEKAVEAPASAAPALADPEKKLIREAARDRYLQAYGKLARDMEAQVHHRIALEFQHLYGRADPNRLSNLIALEQRAHTMATNQWAAFRQSLNGRIPTPSEIYSVAQRVDRTIQPYMVRPGVARPMLPPLPKQL